MLWVVPIAYIAVSSLVAALTVGDPIKVRGHAQDTIVTPAAQRFMASRAHARTVQVRAGHLSLISQPGPASDLIIKAARATD